MQLYMDLMGTELKAQAEFAFGALGKQMVYLNMANFLADALHIIKPAPYTGSLAGLFAEGQAVGDLGPGLLGPFPDPLKLQGEVPPGSSGVPASRHDG